MVCLNEEYFCYLSKNYLLTKYLEIFQGGIQ